MEQSFTRVGKAKIDLIQVHNLGDPATQLPILREVKKQGRIRYMGITTTFDQQYAELVRIMRNEPLDFIGIDYAIDGRDVEQEILPLAQERKIAVLAYALAARLFRRVANRPLPAGRPRSTPGRGRRCSGSDHGIRPYRRDAGDEPGEEHARQHRRRHRPAAERGLARMAAFIDALPAA